MKKAKAKVPGIKIDEKLSLEAYKILVDLLKKDDTLFWQQNSIFLAINGGLMTLLGAIQPKDSNIIIPVMMIAISFLICLLAAVICIMWFLISNRFIAFYDHWFEQIKYLEKEYLKPIQVFTWADEYFTGRKELTLGEKYFKLDRVSKFIKISSAIKCLSLTLGTAWFSATIYFFIRFLNNLNGC
jgi:hypothetical protein